MVSRFRLAIDVGNDCKLLELAKITSSCVRLQIDSGSDCNILK